MLLPVSNPKAANSLALQHASHKENKILFDALYPKSNPHAALQEMKDCGTNTRMLEERMNIDKTDKERKIISKELTNNTSVHKTKRKI